MNTSRSWSSRYTSAYGSSPLPDEPWLLAMAATSRSFCPSTRRRRRTSSARRYAVVVSQAAGLSGIPSSGQRIKARSIASWMLSSARYQSLVVRIRPARMRSRSVAIAAATACATSS